MVILIFLHRLPFVGRSFNHLHTFFWILCLEKNEFYPKKLLLGSILIFFTVLECSNVPTKRDSDWAGYTETGKASYYAMKFQSKKTASGELYDKDKKTAAHKKLPFGTKVKVTNAKNSKSVIVKINDRGPFVKGRIIDLSDSAFSSIANLNAGVIQVKIEVIE